MEEVEYDLCMASYVHYGVVSHLPMNGIEKGNWKIKIENCHDTQQMEYYGMIVLTFVASMLHCEVSQDALHHAADQAEPCTSYRGMALFHM